MPVNMHVRDVDEATHRELVRRADAAGVSLRSYVIEVLHRHTALPTVGQWLDEVRADPSLPGEGAESVTLVEEGRRDSDVACAEMLTATLLTLDGRLARSAPVPVEPLPSG